MTNEEIRLAIAKAKGAKLWFRPGAPTAPLLTLKNIFIHSSWQELPITRVIGNEYWDIPNWPEDIAAAWELVEEMEGGDEIHAYEVYMYCGRGDGRYRVTVFDARWNGEDTTQLTKITSQLEDDMPRAICLAWLAWKELR